MNVDLEQLLHPRCALAKDLVACSVCLRVRRGSEWVEAELVIREIRSYELDAPPRLLSGVCEVCAESILGRRAKLVEPIAA